MSKTGIISIAIVFTFAAFIIAGLVVVVHSLPEAKATTECKLLPNFIGMCSNEQGPPTITPPVQSQSPHQTLPPQNPGQQGGGPPTGIPPTR